MKLAGYEIDVIVQGYPGKSVCHGGLGWSSIVLIRGQGRIALVDVGSFGIRKPLIERLAQRGLKPADVTDVILTHAHHDHSINWTLFRHARIVIGEREMHWALEEPWGETPVPELYIRELSSWPTLVLAANEQEVLPGITGRIAAGHTPGGLVYVLEGEHHDIVFTGDAAKNRAELISRHGDMSYNPAETRASIEMIWQLWQRRPGTVLVPGHDLPMTQSDGRIKYVGRREAAIRAWFGENLEQTQLFELSLH